jgi:hypothetical protein
MQWLLLSAIHISIINTKTQTAKNTTMICVSNRQDGHVKDDLLRVSA